MKKIEYPNRGHLLSDYFVDGISRVYEHEGNLIITLESPTGIETPNAILKNECVRLVIPKSQFNEFAKSIVTIKEQLDFKEVPENEPTENIQKDESFLGSAFNVSD
jgi:hypothetical protein